MKKMYAVMSVSKTIGVDMSFGHQTMRGSDERIALSWAGGMIGAIPVFSTREAAERYAAGEFKVCEISNEPHDHR